MILPDKHQLKLLIVFYKSTLTVNITSSVLLCIVGYPDILLAFGICFLSGGSILSLLFLEISKQNEYYFYYNKGLSKWTLLLSCFIINLFIGIMLIVASYYL